MPTMDHYDTGTPCWVDLTTPDPEAATTFYTRVFGWETDATTTDAGGAYVFFRKDGHAVAGCAPLPPDRAGGMPPAWTTYLAGDADTITERAAEAGGRVLEKPFDVADRGRTAAVADPTGAVTGVWQAGTHRGAELVNEAGTVVWNDLNTHDLAASARWMERVFGVTTEDLPSAPSPYRTFAVDGEVRGGIGQMGEDAERFPSHWMTSFQVDDADATCAAVTDAGGEVRQQPFDTEFGRMAVLADPQGAVFMVNRPPDGQG